jgi:hypothetical protein
MTTAKKSAAKKAAKTTKAKQTVEERLATLEDAHDSLLAQLKLHGIHLDLGEDEEEDAEESGTDTRA